MVTSPVSDTIILWLREISLVAFFSSSGRANGRSPAKALSTSFLSGCRTRYCPAVFSKKSISPSRGTGSKACSFTGVSVVPMITCLRQGTANITRPSEVLGTITAASCGRNERSTTRWIPWLGVIISRAPGSSILMTSSTKTPVAFTTARAFSLNSSPLSASVAVTPHTWSFS